MLRKNIRILDKIYRHPIKSIGCELLDGISLYSGKTMPGDRVWALAHNKTRMPSTKKEWMPCSSFLRGTIAPSFMAITSLYNEKGVIIENIDKKLKKIFIKNINKI